MRHAYEAAITIWCLTMGVLLRDSSALLSASFFFMAGWWFADLRNNLLRKPKLEKP